LAETGKWIGLPSAVNNEFALVPITSNIAPTFGTYSYSKTFGAGARIKFYNAVQDYRATIIMNFSSQNTGTLRLSLDDDSSIFQEGIFSIKKGSAPDNIVGKKGVFTITDGDGDYGDYGVWEWIPKDDGTYVVNSLSGDGTDSNGTYNYVKLSGSTAKITYNDSEVGAGSVMQMTFDSNSTGAVFLKGSDSEDYQTCTFKFESVGDGGNQGLTITKQPIPVTVAEGQPVQFKVEADATGQLNYLWQKDGKTIPQANTAIFKIDSAKKSDEGTYQAILTSGNKTYESDAVKLTVLERQITPVITEQPLGRSVILGDSVEFDIGASGTEPLNYQWYKDGKQIAGATDVTYRIASVSQDDLGIYSVRVQNKAGKAYSQTVKLSLAVLHTLTVASRDSDSGVTVTLSPLDWNGQAGGTTQFTRVYSKGTEVTLTAVQSVGANQFKEWLKNGEPAGTEPTVTVTMNYDRTLLAVYEPKPVTLTVTSLDPDSGVTVTVSPADQSGQSDGRTQFTRVYSNGAEVTLSAKQSVGANQFKQWLANGEQVGTDPTVTVIMDYDRTLRAVYEPDLKYGLVVYYPFNGNAYDESGNGNDGEVNGATLATDRFGNSGKAYRFNETGDVIFTSLNTRIETKTFCAWVKLHDLSQKGGGVVALQIPNGANQFDAIVYNETSEGWRFGSDYSKRSSVAKQPEISQDWIFVCATYDDHSYKFYRNGNLLFNNTSFNVYNFYKPQLLIGQRHGSPGLNLSDRYLKALIDDVRIYNRALSEAEVAALYELEKPDLLEIPQVNPESSLVAYYPFNGNANDESGNGNDGEVIGATLGNDRYGNSNSAYEFNGVNNYIDLTNADFAISGRKPRSIFGWIKTAKKTNTLVSLGTASPNNAFTLGNISGNGVLSVMGYSNDFYPREGIKYNDDKWNFIGVTYDADGNITTYVNGKLDNVGERILNTSGNKNYIGVNNHGFTNHTKGSIDDVRIYSRALSAAEVAALYELVNTLKHEPIELKYPITTISPFTFTFSTVEGVTYEVQVTQDLKNWSKLGEVNGTSGEVEFTDPRLPKVPYKRNYFRVKLVE
jgi:hypothetical protein